MRGPVPEAGRSRALRWPLSIFVSFCCGRGLRGPIRGKNGIEEVSQLEIEVIDRDKRVNIWLTKSESQNVELKESLKPIYRAYKAKKYLVAVYESGTENLEELTRELLLYNRIRLRELEKTLCEKSASRDRAR